jgi:hypothetical protein
MQAKSIKKSPQIRKWQFSSESESLEMFVIARAELSIACSDAGRQSDRNDEQPKNALDSMRFNLDGESNVNEQSDRQSKKHSPLILSTEAGIQIDTNLEQL